MRKLLSIQSAGSNVSVDCPVNGRVRIVSVQQAAIVGVGSGAVLDMTMTPAAGGQIKAMTAQLETAVAEVDWFIGANATTAREVNVDPATGAVTYDNAVFTIATAPLPEVWFDSPVGLKSGVSSTLLVTYELEVTAPSRARARA